MKNIIQNINKAFDHRIRLGIMSVLMVNESVDFNTMKEFLGATDGNLASHIKALEADNVKLSLNVNRFNKAKDFYERHGFNVVFAEDVELDTTAARQPGCAVGRLAVFRARLAVARNPQSQYVHADCHRCLCCLGIQCGGNVYAAYLSAYDADE